jgi:diacylglycerol kinase (ATP)
MRVGIIINPVSGRHGHSVDTGPRRIDLARRLAAAAGVEADASLTHAGGHAVELARAFARRAFDVIIAWGGDGTINEVAGPLVGTRTALGIVSSGSGDGLARSLGLPRDVQRAFALAIRGPAGAIDVGFLGDRHFLNVAGVGFDAVVARAFNTRARRGFLGYLAHGLRIGVRYKPDCYQVQLGRDRLEGDRFLIAFANGREYGNGVVLAPDANIGDGWLDAVVVDRGSALRQMWRARRLAIGTRRPAEGVHRTRVQAARVSGPRLVFASSRAPCGCRAGPLVAADTRLASPERQPVGATTSWAAG